MEKNFKRTTVTAALPYANGPVHIGHMAGVYIPADIYVRYLRAKGEDVKIEDVMKNLLERDYIDSHRETSPLSKADDAIVLDNTDMTMADQMVWLKEIMAERFGC